MMNQHVYQSTVAQCSRFLFGNVREHLKHVIARDAPLRALLSIALDLIVARGRLMQREKFPIVLVATVDDGKDAFATVAVSLQRAVGKLKLSKGIADRVPQARKKALLDANVIWDITTDTNRMHLIVAQGVLP